MFALINLSCAEILIGVTCTCMPSVSKMLHHHNWQIQKPKTLFSAVVIGLRSTWTRMRGQATALESESTKTAACYKSRNFVPLEDVVISSITSGGRRPGFSEDAIHLKHEIVQEEYRM